MWRRTYERLREQAFETEVKAEELFEAKAARFGAWPFCHGNLFLLVITRPPTEAEISGSNGLALCSARLERPLLT
jgi:hypothetical protein